jgi:hypothetical protein
MRGLLLYLLQRPNPSPGGRISGISPEIRLTTQAGSDMNVWKCLLFSIDGLSQAQ